MIRYPLRKANILQSAANNLCHRKIYHSPTIQPTLSLSMQIGHMRPVAPSLFFSQIQRVFSGTNRLFLVYPVLAGSLFSGFKSQMADVFTQTKMEHKSLSQMDWTRNFLFFLFGSTYCGAITYAILVKGYSRLFPGKSGYSVVKRVAFDQLVTTPFLYFPCFYSCKCLVFEKGNFSMQKWREYLDVYWNDNFYQDVTTAASVWGPVHCITFTLIPNHLKLLWIGGVSAVWTVILSMMRGSIEEEESTAVSIEIDLFEQSTAVSMGNTENKWRNSKSDHAMYLTI